MAISNALAWQVSRIQAIADLRVGSPPAGGVLTGKYSRDDLTATNAGDAAVGDGTRTACSPATGCAR